MKDHCTIELGSSRSGENRGAMKEAPDQMEEPMLLS